jgi:hypothetical protein
MRPALLLLALAAAACGDAPDSTGPTPPTTAPAPPAGSSQQSDRTPDDAERAAMLDVLRGDSSPDRRVSLIVSPGMQEPAALAAALEGIFREAGWQASTTKLTGMVLKPGGVRILVGDATEPPAVESVRQALAAGGLIVETGTDYRAYYDEKKRENPSWPGVPIRADQPFIVLIPPEAAA